LIKDLFPLLYGVAGFGFSVMFLLAVCAVALVLAGTFVLPTGIKSVYANSTLVFFEIGALVALLMVLFTLMTAATIYNHQQDHLAIWRRNILDHMFSADGKHDLPTTVSSFFIKPASKQNDREGEEKHQALDIDPQTYNELQENWASAQLLHTLFEHIQKDDTYATVLGVPIRPTLYRLFAGYCASALATLIARFASSF